MVTTRLQNARMTRQAQKKERENIVVWKEPCTTVVYCVYELWHAARDCADWVLHRQRTVVLAASLMIGLLTIPLYCLNDVDGPYHEFIQPWKQYITWCLWWVSLGILSSVGLGTGLHTFLLYLGPFIASVTMAAYECQTTAFPQPPYPDDIICPHENPDQGIEMTIWQIIYKVRVEAFCWGAGTAIGELPPYFVARAHRLSGNNPEDEDDEDEFEQLEKKIQSHAELTTVERAKYAIEKIIEKVGFWGILACASIPNPLFDLAGITCGHFLVPFWTFFGATLIGKAVIKVFIQTMFVVLAFNENLIGTVIHSAGKVPLIGHFLEDPIQGFFESQKEKLHNVEASPDDVPLNGSILSWMFNNVVTLMLIYFLLCLVNSMAKNYHKRMEKMTKQTKDE